MKSINDIVPGYYKTRLRRNSHPSPLRFYYGPAPDPADPDGDPMQRERSWSWQCILRGEVQSEQRCLELWQSRLEPITEAEYRYLLDDLRWAVENDPEDPAAMAYEAVDLNKLPPTF